jgi:hypothetical protein
MKQRKGRPGIGIGSKRYTKKKGNRGTDCCFSVAQYLNSELVFLVIAIYISHEIRQTRTRNPLNE